MRIRTLSAIKTAALLAAASLLAGCAGGGTPASNAFAQVGSGPTVAFESIDGPPPQVFERMVGLLDSESRTRNLSIVSREAPAAYRVRSYLSAQVYRGRTTIAWVWDIYDRDQQRALRLSGEESAGKSGRGGPRDAWAAADDSVLRRIAQSGLSGLNGIVGGTAPADPTPAPQSPQGNGPGIASIDDSTKTAALGFSER